jgi:hypothetical protein
MNERFAQVLLCFLTLQIFGSSLCMTVMRITDR